MTLSARADTEHRLGTQIQGAVIVHIDAAVAAAQLTHDGLVMERSDRIVLQTQNSHAATAADSGHINRTASCTHGNLAITGKNHRINNLAALDGFAITHGKCGAVLAAGHVNGGIGTFNDTIALIGTHVKAISSIHRTAINGEETGTAHLGAAHVELLLHIHGGCTHIQGAVIGNRATGVVTHTADENIQSLVVRALAIKSNNSSAFAGTNGKRTRLVLVPDAIPAALGQSTLAGDVSITSIVGNRYICLCSVDSHHSHGSHECPAQCEIQVQFHNILGKKDYMGIQWYHRQGTTREHIEFHPPCKEKSTKGAFIMDKKASFCS